MIGTYEDVYEGPVPDPDPDPVPVPDPDQEPFSMGGTTEVSAVLVNEPAEENSMTLQDELRGEQVEVADTGTLLSQAADRIDELEALVASGSTAQADRIVALEGAIAQIQSIITVVSV